jgi:hypothetical protein
MKTGLCSAGLAVAGPWVGLAAGCGGSSGSQGLFVAAPADLGHVAFHYTLPGGNRVSALTYTLSNSAHSYSATVGGNALVGASFVIQDVQAGNGYGVSLSAQSDDGSVSCSGTVGIAADGGPGDGTFTVVARTTTKVTVPLACVDVANASRGGVLVNGIVDCCATWDAIVATPSTLSTQPPNNTSQLLGNASGPCTTDAGVGLACTWSVLSGTGTLTQTPTDATGSTAGIFTCPQVSETDTLHFFCTDGPLPDGGACPAFYTTGTTTVTCKAPGIPYSVVRHGAINATQQTDGIASPVFVENHEISLTTTPISDTLVSTVALPTAASGSQQPFALQGVAATTANNDGALSLSADGHYLALVGYGAPAGATNIVMNTTVPRVVARIDALGRVDTSTSFVLPSVDGGSGGAFVSTFVRSAVSSDGAEFWVSGRGFMGGVWYIPFGAAGGGVQLNTMTARDLGVSAGQLYGDTDPIGLQLIFAVGTGMPLAPPGDDVGLPGFPMTGASQLSPWQFAFGGPTTVYIATDQTSGPVNGIQKWTLANGTWSLQTTFNLAPGQTFAGNAIATPVGFRGLAIVTSTSNSTTFVASTVEPAPASSPLPPNHLAVFVDNGGPYDPSGLTQGGVVYAQAPPGTVLRGLALTPK